ncbi:uncharacterized protein LOC144128067 isoform X2 [Amblyomma americanum]
MLGQPKQKSKEEDARKKRDRHKTGGGSAQCTVSAQSEQVIAVASHIMTRKTTGNLRSWMSRSHQRLLLVRVGQLQKQLSRRAISFFLLCNLLMLPAQLQQAAAVLQLLLELPLVPLLLKQWPPVTLAGLQEGGWPFSKGLWQMRTTIERSYCAKSMDCVCC